MRTPGLDHLLMILPMVISLFSCNKGSDENPNVIFIMTDDMGYETVGYNHATNYSTPNLDRLAREAVVFTNCAAQPLCVPTRVKLITGQYNLRNYRGWGSPLDLEFPALGKMMQDAGYVTGAFGKWHLKRSPEELGFDEYCYFDGSPGELEYSEFFKRYNYNSPLVEDGKQVTAAYAPDKFNERVLKFIDDYGNSENPFFIYYPMTLAHNPFKPTPDSEDQMPKDFQQNFEEMVAYADKMIGKVIEKLKEEGLYENTVLFYTSDNGSMLLAHQMENGRIIYGGKGKQVTDGCHVPLFVKYDGNHRVVDDLVDFTDFYATLASLAGVPEDRLSEKMDGISLYPVLEGEERRGKPYIFSVFQYPLNAYIRDRDYKYFMDGRLYDILGDPGEFRPYYRSNDTPETEKASWRLIAQMDSVLHDQEFAASHTREQLLDKHPDYKEGQDSSRMLRTHLFDRLEYHPRTEILSYDITGYLEDEAEEYSVRISRGRNFENSGNRSGHADVVIRSVKVLRGELPFSKKDLKR